MNQSICMATDQFNPFPINIWPIIGATAAWMIFNCMLKNYLPQFFSLFLCFLDKMHFSRSISDSFEYFSRISWDNISIASMSLSPCFFQNENPKLIAIRLAEQGLSFLINWYKIIDEDFLDDPINSQSNFINSVRTKSLIAKYSLYPLLFFSESSEGRQEIAIS